MDNYGRQVPPLVRRSDRAVAQVLAVHQRVYTEVAPSGVRVVSGVPLMEARWWDNPVLHIVWSWTSWTAAILNTYGHPGLKRWFNAHWTREGHPEPVKTDWKAWKKENEVPLLDPAKTALRKEMRSTWGDYQACLEQKKEHGQ